MSEAVTLVLTSIAEPNATLRGLAEGARQAGSDFIVIGDEASPPQFELEGCRFYGLADQRTLGLRFAQICPTRHYARKNIGYLLAMRDGASVIVETDDDTVTYDEFWVARTQSQTVQMIAGAGWVNVYRYFSSDTIWPRGLPLDEINSAIPPFESLPTREVACPIQQGLVDDDPDVDAVYRLFFELPYRFERGRSVALTSDAWCPFNSQNTAWWPAAFPLMYLPAYCSFRMTDIWRSFVAQRIAWINDWGVLFHEPTARQERNAHDLMRDFRDEVPGYLHNKSICAALDELRLRPGAEQVGENMRIAYERLVGEGWLKNEELELLDAWLDDLEQIRTQH